jgi:hypothetical protein
MVVVAAVSQIGDAAKKEKGPFRVSFYFDFPTKPQRTHTIFVYLVTLWEQPRFI